MGMMSEFKEFAVKGNVMDLAVGVIVGAAFGKIVDSLVGDLIMPLIGRLTGGLDFSGHFIALSQVPPGIPLTVDALKKGRFYVQIHSEGAPNGHLLGWLLSDAKK